ncbi:MAG: hypothetical protein ACE5ES_04785, partial [Candidatus Nanoarchaeia archaeon]
KFVITDSNFIDEDNFVVHVANRPPSVNLIVLDAGVNFNSSIRKLGNLTIDVLRKKLAKYSFKQRQKAKTFVTKFKNLEPSPKGAIAYYNVLEKILNELNKLDDEEYLVNIGFGGGSYYKIFDNVPVPKFPSKKFRNSEEEAHTTFTVQIENEQYQLGWCKLKIEEL